MGRLERWLPVILQTLVFGGMLWGYATAQEHRMTVVEEAFIRLERLTELHNEQLRYQSRQLERLIAIEEFYHGRSLENGQ